MKKIKLSKSIVTLFAIFILYHSFLLPAYAAPPENVSCNTIYGEETTVSMNECNSTLASSETEATSLVQSESVSSASDELGWYDYVMIDGKYLVNFKKYGWFGKDEAQGNTTFLYKRNAVHYEIEGETVCFYQKDRDDMLYSYCDSSSQYFRSLEKCNRNEKYSIDLSSLQNNCYVRISTCYPYFIENGKNFCTTSNVYILRYQDQLYLCDIFCDYCVSDDFDWYYECQQSLAELTKDLDPSDYTTPFNYTIRGEESIEDWVNLSNELCKNVTSDEEKILKIHDWLADNMLYGKNDTGKTVFESKIGVCDHFARVFLIMTRAQGIPTLRINCNPNHVFNAVYVDGIWHIIDVTWDNNNFYRVNNVIVNKYEEKDYGSYAVGIESFWGLRFMYDIVEDNTAVAVSHANFLCGFAHVGEGKAGALDLGMLCEIMHGRSYAHIKVEYDKGKNETKLTCLYDGRYEILQGNLFTDYDENGLYLYNTCSGISYMETETHKHDQVILYSGAETQTVSARSVDKSKKYSVIVPASWSGDLTISLSKYPAGGEKYVLIPSCSSITLTSGIPAGDYEFSVHATGNSYTNEATEIFKITVLSDRNSASAKKTQKSRQKITVLNPAKKYRAKSLRKQGKTFSIGAKANTALSYQVVKHPKNAKKYINISKKGKVLVKKGAKKGTYKIRVTAEETSMWKRATKYITLRII